MQGRFAAKSEPADKWKKVKPTTRGRVLMRMRPRTDGSRIPGQGIDAPVHGRPDDQSNDKAASEVQLQRECKEELEQRSAAGFGKWKGRSLIGRGGQIVLSNAPFNDCSHSVGEAHKPSRLLLFRRIENADRL